MDANVLCQGWLTPALPTRTYIPYIHYIHTGYTLNKAALKLLVVHGLPKYYVDERTSEEDVRVARILREFGVLPYETKDQDGGERYNPFWPGKHLYYRVAPNGTRARGYYGWYSQYSIDIKSGLDHSATYSVAFHYIKDDEMYRMHALLHGMCPVPSRLQSIWPWASAFSDLLSWRDFTF